MIMSIGFIGAGNMASAIIETLRKTGYIKPENIYIYDTDIEKSKRFAKYAMHICTGAKDAFDGRTYTFLCIKPQVFRECSQSFSGLANNTDCIVSIMAGIKIFDIKKVFGDIHTIRVMPNTPMLVSGGASALVKPDDVSDELFAPVFDIFNSCGKAAVVEEKDISAVTALSGSGPAYFFKFARAALEEAEKLGLSEQTAKDLLFQTMRGSADMLEQSGYSPDELVKMVTSPKGTTLAANESFDRDDYEGSIKRAMKACFDRAEELSKL